MQLVLDDLSEESDFLVEHLDLLKVVLHSVAVPNDLVLVRGALLNLGSLESRRLESGLGESDSAMHEGLELLSQGLPHHLTLGLEQGDALPHLGQHDVLFFHLLHRYYYIVTVSSGCGRWPPARSV